MQEYQIVGIRAREGEGYASRRGVQDRIEARVPLSDLECGELSTVHNQKTNRHAGGLSDLPGDGRTVFEIVRYLEKF